MVSQYTRNAMEVTGAVMLALLFLGPLLLSLVGSVVTVFLTLFGLDSHNGALFVALFGSILVTTWLVFELVDLFYSRWRTLPPVRDGKPNGPTETPSESA